MRQVAERLAQEFTFVRIDLYDRPEGILVGEITHSPLAGLPIFDLPEWDDRLGQLWSAALQERGTRGLSLDLVRERISLEWDIS